MKKRERKPNIPDDYEEKFDLNVFNQRLEELRMEQKFSYEDLADKIGVTTKTIRMWRNGNNKAAPVPYKQIYKLARLFHVDPEYLYQADAPQHLSDESEIAQEEYLHEYYKPYEKILPSIIQLIQSLGYDVDEDPGRGRYVIYGYHDYEKIKILSLDMIEKILAGIKYSIL